MINVEFRMRHLKPRWALTVDPHLFVDGKHLGPLTKTWSRVEVDARGPMSIVVAASESPAAWKLDPERGRSLSSPYLYRTVTVQDGDRVRVDYRPNRLYGYLLRGSLTVRVEPSVGNQ